jgi:serine/threonine protein kinase
MTDNSSILKVYGISQNPDTRNYIIVLYYAAGGNFNYWISVNNNYKNFSWKKKLETLINLAYGLKGIHERQMIHRDFHTGNVLFNTPFMNNKIFISDMGLCGEVGNIDKTKIYGVMPYVAPEVLRRKPYTQAADIYSFGMVMYFVATGRQPFDNCAHDHNLVLDICKGVKPELNKPEVPKSYINLMNECLDLDPENRPNITKLYQSLYSITLKNSEIKEAENYRILHFSSLMENRQTATHSQAIYTSRLLNPYTENLSKENGNSECLDCAIDNNK